MGETDPDACLTEEDILRYVDGEDSVPTLDRERIERHVARCADCGHLLAAAASVLLPPGEIASLTERGVALTVPSGGGEPEIADLAAVLGDERWEVRARLGEGGMGAVYEVFDRERGEAVAMKTLLRADPTTIFQFKQEFRSLVDVTHPNLAGYYEMSRAGGVWFFTMELVAGVHLGVHLERERRQHGRERWLAALIDAMAQLANALVALHRAGKLHRDVKPANVLVSPSGRVVLVDLGLVFDYRRNLHDARVAPGLVGTVPYMSPEQARGEPVGVAADWYAFGALLYHLLTGRPPFEGSPEEILRAKVVVDAPRLPADVPPALADLCAALLARDPTRRAGSAAVFAALSAGGDGVETDPEGPFVGRSDALAALRARWDETRAGRAVVVHLVGPSGIGKTALARRFLAGLEQRGAVALQGRCYEGQLLPYRAIDELVDQLAHYLLAVEEKEGPLALGGDAHVLAELFPVLARVAGVRNAPVPGPRPDAETRKWHAFAALAGLIARVVERAPLVLFLDDLQWGDRDSAGFLAELATGSAGALLLVLGHRGVESPLLGELRARLPQARVVALEPLATDEATQLARALVADAAEVEALVRQADGSPLFLHEMARWKRGAVATLEELVAGRTAELSAEAARLLAVVAVAGHPLIAETAAAAAGLDGPPQRLLGALRAARLVVTRETAEGTEVTTAHDRFGAAVADSLSEGERRLRHRRLADALLATAADPQLVFLHLDAGRDPRAAAQAVAAADAAFNALAFWNAAELYGRALVLGAPDPAGLRRQRAEALAHAGHAAAAGDEYATLLRDAGPSEVPALEQRAADQYLRGGRFDDGLTLLRRVVARAGFRFPESTGGALAALAMARLRLAARGYELTERPAAGAPTELLARLDTIWPAIVGLSLVDPLRSAFFATHYTRLALEAGERDRLIRALGVEAAYLSSIGGRHRWDKADELGRVLVELAAGTRDAYAGAYASFALGATAFFAGAWREAVARCDEAARRFRDECAGAAWEQATSVGFAHAALAYLGEIGELSARLPRALAMVDERGDVYGAAVLRTGLNTVGLLAEGKTAEVRRLADEGLARWTRTGYHAQHYMHLVAVAQADLYDGDGEGAWTRVSEAWPDLTGAGYLRLSYVRVEARHLRARAALAAGGPTRIAVAMREARALARETFPSAPGFAAGVRAGLAARAGDAREARAELAAAETAFSAAGMALHARAARWLAGGADAPAAVDPAAFARMLLPGIRR